MFSLPKIRVNNGKRTGDLLKERIRKEREIKKRRRRKKKEKK